MVARKRNINPQRENVSDVKTDNVAKNRLASSSANYKNTGKKSTAKVTKGKKLNPLLPKKVCSYNRYHFTSILSFFQEFYANTFFFLVTEKTAGIH
jgi:hypothetical protein